MPFVDYVFVLLGFSSIVIFIWLTATLYMMIRSIKPVKDYQEDLFL